ncbi:MAG: class I SAM-dependent rRNA methyltransferase [Gammaproteobacteria bacterium]|nr:class I SAM-dependent rRNA methyltransferase [Gammaproteobacteria bacterium]
MPPTTVNVRGASRWAAGHPWIYRGDVALADDVASGDIVPVEDARGRFLGQACVSRASKIVLRRISRSAEPVDEAFFRARIADAVRLRRSLYPGDNAFRAVHGDGDGLPGLVVDRYGEYLSVQFLTPAMDRRREMLTGLLVEEFACKGIMNRSDAGVRALEGLPAEKGLLWGTVPDPVVIREGQLEFAVSLEHGQKTGSFLDQRENHIVAGRYARGLALDCFSYLGGFALQMARRAERVTAVDSSAPACEQTRANAARNGIANVEVVTDSAFDFLRAAVDAGRQYDTIVLDPPAFAKSKDATAAGVRGYKEINRRALQLLTPGGYLITSSCSHHVDEQAFEALLQAAAADARREVQIVEKRGAGRDHPVLLALRETRYLKCYVLRVM